MPLPSVSSFAAVALVLLLDGCDQLGIQTPATVAVRLEAEGKAIGAGCRHAGRAIEDCYALNRKADKAAIFAGWREMNDYMRENGIEVVTPQAAVQPASAPAAAAGDAAAAETGGEHLRSPRRGGDDGRAGRTAAQEAPRKG